MRRGLKVTGTTSPIVISEGSARVNDNVHYWNTSDEYMEIPTPDRLPRIDCIVLCTDWEKQTVRLARIVGVEGEGVPALNAHEKQGIITSLWRWLLSLFYHEAVDAGSSIHDTPLARCLVMPNGILTVIDTWEDIEVAGPPPWDKAKTTMKGDGDV